MALDAQTRQEFLAEPHVAALAVDAGPGRGPLTVPIWYQYAPGGDLWILTAEDSRKAALIDAAGRFSMMVDRVSPTIRYVSVEGPVVHSAAATVDDLREMASRYLPPEHVEPYLGVALAEHGAQRRVHLRPERWLSADLGAS